MIMTDTTLIPALEFIFSAHVTVDAALDLGDVGKGGRRIIPIAGGNFSAELEARYTLRTVDGVLIYVRNHGLRHGPPDVIAALAAGRPVDPARYYFRGATFFETSDARYAWLTKHIIVCTGEREPVAVKLRFFKML